MGSRQLESSTLWRASPNAWNTDVCWVPSCLAATDARAVPAPQVRACVCSTTTPWAVCTALM